MPPDTEVHHSYTYFDPVRKKRFTSRYKLTAKTAARLVEIGEWVDAKPIPATRIERELVSQDDWGRNSTSAFLRPDR